MSVEVVDGLATLAGRQIKNKETVRCGLGSVSVFYVNDGVEIVRYTGSGRERYRYTIRKDGEWRIGKDRCYRVVRPEEEADPFRRLLRALDLPVAILHRHAVGEAVELAGMSANLSCHVPNGKSAYLKTDSEEPVVLGARRGSQHYTEEDWTVELSKATYAVVLGHRANSNGNVFPRIWEVHVWGNPDVVPVEKLLVEHLYGPEATLAMLAAQKSGRVKEWLAIQVGVGATPWLAKIGSREFPLYDYATNVAEIRAKGDYQCPEHEHALARIFNNLGNEEILALLPEEQRSYAEALLNKDTAGAWLTSGGWFFRKDGKLYYAGENGQLGEVERGRYVAYGPVAVLHRHGLYEDVIVTSPELGEPLELASTKSDFHNWEYEMVGEGVCIHCEMDNGRRRFKKVEVSGHRRFVWLQTQESFKDPELAVWRVQ
jgi:hypothetical protein